MLLSILEHPGIFEAKVLKNSWKHIIGSVLGNATISVKKKIPAGGKDDKNEKTAKSNGLQQLALHSARFTASKMGDKNRMVL